MASNDDSAAIADMVQHRANAPAEHKWPAPVPDQEPAEPLNGGTENGNDEFFWAHHAIRYEWQDSYGDVGPAVPELEQELFHNDMINRAGRQLNNLLSIKVTAEATERPAPITNFSDAGLHPTILANVKKCQYLNPTPIQAYAIPAALQGRDVIGIAQTGSGKTAAYLIPALSKLMGKAKKLCAPRPALSNGFNPAMDIMRAEPLILIVVPTRELATQIFDEARRLSYRSMMRPCVAYGGAPLREQRDELRKGCDILIATPGRLRDFMNDTTLLVLSRLRFTIIDEADEMLHDDWEEEMGQILGAGNANSQHQYLFFSATFDKHMRKIAKKYLDQDHVRLRIGRAGSVHSNVKQNVVYVDRNMKDEALYDLIVAMPPARTIVFCRSKKSCDFVDDKLFNKGLPSTSIHADRTQMERESALRAFRSGKSPILITTAVTARGLDVRHVMHVINYDMPSGIDEYIHRIGRTARIGNEGLATSFYNDADEAIAPMLTKLLIECNQEVPEFLEQFKPEGGVLDFEDDSGVEENDELANGGDAAAEGDSWGGAVQSTATAPVVDDWNSNEVSGNNGGW